MLCTTRDGVAEWIFMAVQSAIVMSILWWSTTPSRSITPEALLHLNEVVHRLCADGKHEAAELNNVLWSIEDVHMGDENRRNLESTLRRFHCAQRSCVKDVEHVSLWGRPSVSRQMGPTFQRFGMSLIIVATISADPEDNHPECIVREMLFSITIECKSVSIGWLTNNSQICQFVRAAVARSRSLHEKLCTVATDRLRAVAARAAGDLALKIPDFVSARSKRSAASALEGRFLESARDAMHADYHPEVSSDNHVPLEQRCALIATVLVPFIAHVVASTVNAANFLRFV